MIAAAKVKESMELRRIAKPTFSPRQRLPCLPSGNTMKRPGILLKEKCWHPEVDLWGKTTLGRSGRSGRIFAERRRQAGFAVGSGCPSGAGLFRVDRFRSGTGHRTADTGGPAGRSTSGKAQVRGRIDFRKSLASGTGRIGQNPNPGTWIREGDSPQRESDYFTGRRISRRSGERESIGQQQLMTALPVGLSSRILERRPDIRQAEYRLKAAHAKVGVAYTSMFPEIYFNRTL